MGTNLTHSFSTRAEAERAVEHLVQQLGIERSDIFISPAADENSAGQTPNGADEPTVLEEGRDDAALEGSITVSVDLNEDADISAVKEALAAEA